MSDERAEASEEFAARRETHQCRTGGEHKRRNLFGSTFFSYEKGGKRIKSKVVAI